MRPEGTAQGQLKQKAESDRAEKMGEMLSKLGAMELDMRSLLEKHATTVAEAKARDPGYSLAVMGLTVASLSRSSEAPLQSSRNRP